MDHDFFEMYLEEMGAVIPLSESEKRIVLEGAAAGNAKDRSRLVEGSLREALEVARSYDCLLYTSRCV